MPKKDNARKKEIRELIHEEMKNTSGHLGPTSIKIISVMGFILSAFILISGIIQFWISFVNAGDIGLSGDYTLLAIIWFILSSFGLIAFYLLLKMKKSGMLLVILIGIISIIMILIIQISIIDIAGIIIFIVWLVIILCIFKNKRLFS